MMPKVGLTILLTCHNLQPLGYVKSFLRNMKSLYYDTGADEALSYVILACDYGMLKGRSNISQLVTTIQTIVIIITVAF